MTLFLPRKVRCGHSITGKSPHEESMLLLQANQTRRHQNFNGVPSECSFLWIPTYQLEHALHFAVCCPLSVLPKKYHLPHFFFKFSMFTGVTPVWALSTTFLDFCFSSLLERIVAAAPASAYTNLFDPSPTYNEPWYHPYACHLLKTSLAYLVSFSNSALK